MDIFLSSSQNWTIFRGHFYAFKGFLMVNVQNGGYFRGLVKFQIFLWGAGFYRTQYPASYTHKSLGRTRQFTLPASVGTQVCLLCLSLNSQIPKLFRNDSGSPISYRLSINK